MATTPTTPTITRLIGKAFLIMRLLPLCAQPNRYCIVRAVNRASNLGNPTENRSLYGWPLQSLSLDAGAG